MMRARRTSSGRQGVLLLAMLAVLGVEGGLRPSPAAAQADLVGQWQTLPYDMPINPIHAGLLHTGRVLVIAGSENDPTITTYRSAVWNPATGTISVQSTPWDLFCNGMSYLPDGRALVTGGTLRYDPGTIPSGGSRRRRSSIPWNRGAPQRRAAAVTVGEPR
jgi:hypothetical protein